MVSVVKTVLVGFVFAVTLTACSSEQDVAEASDPTVESDANASGPDPESDAESSVAELALPTPSPTPAPLLTTSQLSEIQASLDLRSGIDTPAQISPAAKTIAAIASELGSEGEELLASAQRWGKTGKNFEKQQAKQNVSGAQQAFRTWLFSEPCAFNEVLMAARNLDESITFGDVDQFRAAGLESLLITARDQGLSWSDASDELGWGWAPIVDPRLCSSFADGSPKFLAPATLEKREDAWIWDSDPDGLFYSAVKSNMEGFFEADFFVTVEIIQGELVSAFEMNTATGTGTDAWVSILAGPWWGSCSAMAEAREGLRTSVEPEKPHGCLLL